MLTETTTCDQWYSAWSGLYYSPNPPNSMSLSQAATLICTRTITTSTGSLPVSTTFPSNQNVTITAPNPLPVTLQTINSALYPLNVNVQNTPNVTISSSGNTVQLDASLYPIPVIDQGTAPVEVTFGTGAILNTDLSQQTQANLIGSGFEIAAISVVVLISSLLFYKLIAPTIWKLVRWFF